MSVCHVCAGRTDNANLCGKHARTLEKALSEMPWLLEQLDVTISRQDRETGTALFACRRQRIDYGYEEGTTTLPATPWPLAWDASEVRWGIDNTLATWARHLAESRGLPGPAFRVEVAVDQSRPVASPIRWVHILGESPMAVARWLLTHLESIRLDEAAGVIYDEVICAERDARRAIDRHEPDVFAGRCEALVLVVRTDSDIVPTADVCGAELYAHTGDAEVKCPECGEVYDLIARKRKLAEMVDDEWRRPQEIADGLTSLAEPISASTLRTWIERDARAAMQPPARRPDYPLILQRGIDDDGRALYRVGDVRARIAAVKAASDTPRRGRKLARVAI